MKLNIMKVRKWSKKNVQQALKSLRSCRGSKGQRLFREHKKNGIYEMFSNKDNTLVFSAMIGRSDYLVRFDTRLFKKRG